MQHDLYVTQTQWNNEGHESYVEQFDQSSIALKYLFSRFCDFLQMIGGHYCKAVALVTKPETPAPSKSLIDSQLTLLFRPHCTLETLVKQALKKMSCTM